MRKLFFVCILLKTSLLCSAQQTARIAPVLQAAFAKGETADLVVVLKEQARPVPPAALKDKTAKGRFVFDALRAVALRTQPRVWDIVRTHGLTANAFYIVNAVSIAHCDAESAKALAALPEVAALSADPWVRFAEPTQDKANDAQNRSAIEWGVARIGAPEVWALGYTGQGIVVGGADTGYDWVHPALKNHYKGYDAVADTFDHQYHWHDAIREPSPLNGADTINPCGYKSQGPCDDNAHGTHTMGTMVGDDNQGNQIGVAPGAKWVGCRNMERGWGKPSTYLNCFEWFLAPTDLDDKKPNPDRAPHVINNSWYCAVEEGCTDLDINALMQIAVVNLRNAGVVVVVSNGNFGGQGCNSTYGPPAYFEESFSVGATNDQELIAGFSSKGPVTIDSSFRIKPNVVAPGVNVRSSIPNGGYANFGGTSMAGPHVVGLVALILSARPDLAGQVELIESIVERTAVPYTDPLGCTELPAALPNNTFGYGRVNALEAVRMALFQTPTNDVENNIVAAKVSPNPTADRVVFEIKGMYGPTTIRFFDAKGSLVHTYAWDAQGTDWPNLSLGHLQPGMLFWKVAAAQGTATGRLLVVQGE